MRQVFVRSALILSAFSGAFLPLADGVAEAASQDARAHVDATGSQGCVPAHSEATCQICRVLRIGSLPATRPLAPQLPAAMVSRVPALRVRDRVQRETTADSRAPPAA